MKTYTLDSIISTAKKAFERPFYCFPTVVCGFRFNIHWDDRENLFEAVMSFTPNWGHTHHVYGKTVESLCENITAEINDKLKIWTNGGGFAPEN